MSTEGTAPDQPATGYDGESSLPLRPRSNGISFGKLEDTTELSEQGVYRSVQRVNRMSLIDDDGDEGGEGKLDLDVDDDASSSYTEDEHSVEHSELPLQSEQSAGDKSINNHKNTSNSSSIGLFSPDALLQRYDPLKAGLFDTASPHLHSADGPTIVFPKDHLKRETFPSLNDLSSDSEDDLPKHISSNQQNMHTSPNFESQLKKNTIPILPIETFRRCGDVWRSITWRACQYMDQWLSQPVRKVSKIGVREHSALPVENSVVSNDTGNSANLNSTASRGSIILPSLIVSKHAYARASLPLLMPQYVSKLAAFLLCPFIPSTILPNDYQPQTAHATLGNTASIRSRYLKYLQGCIVSNRISYGYQLYKYIPNETENDPLLNESHEWKRELESRKIRAIIDKDQIRTQSGRAQFRIPSIKRMVERVQYIWSLEHFEIGYKQGMNEILAILLQALAQDVQIESSLDITPDIVELVSVFVSRQKLNVNVANLHNIEVDACEADLYSLFCRFMATQIVYYSALELTVDCVSFNDTSMSWNKLTFEQQLQYMFEPRDYRRVLLSLPMNSIKETSNISDLLIQPPSKLGIKLFYIHHVLLRLVDNEQYQHLENNGVLPQLYLLRWLRLFFSREVAANDILRVWDFLLELSQIADIQYNSNVEIYKNTGHSLGSIQRTRAGALYDQNKQFFTSPLTVADAQTLHTTGEDIVMDDPTVPFVYDDLYEDVGFATATDLFCLTILQRRRDALMAAEDVAVLPTLQNSQVDDCQVLCGSCSHMYKALTLEVPKMSASSVENKSASTTGQSKLLSSQKTVKGLKGSQTIAFFTPWASPTSDNPNNTSVDELSKTSHVAVEGYYGENSQVLQDMPVQKERALEDDQPTSRNMQVVIPLEHSNYMSHSNSNLMIPYGTPTNIHEEEADYASMVPVMPKIYLKQTPLQIRNNFGTDSSVWLQPKQTSITYTNKPNMDVLSPSTKHNVQHTSITIQGNLVKVGGNRTVFRVASLKRRFFVVNGFVLRYWEDQDSFQKGKKCKGAIDLRGRLVYPGDADRFCIMVGKRTDAFAKLQQSAEYNNDYKEYVHVGDGSFVRDAHFASIVDVDNKPEAVSSISRTIQDQNLDTDEAMLHHLKLPTTFDDNLDRVYYLFAYDRQSWSLWLGALSRAADINERGHSKLKK